MQSWLIIGVACRHDLVRTDRDGDGGTQDPSAPQSMLDTAGAARTAEARGERGQHFPFFPESEEVARASGPMMEEGYDNDMTPRAFPPTIDKGIDLDRY